MISLEQFGFNDILFSDMALTPRPARVGNSSMVAVWATLTDSTTFKIVKRIVLAVIPKVRSIVLVTIQRHLD
jgi:hypothetical protein